MIIKSNTPLSDNELRRIKTIMQESIDPQSALAIVFPHTKTVIDGDVAFIGSPPWDLTQEIILE